MQTSTTMIDTTFDLLKKWHAGDRQALERLVERHLPWIRAYVRKRLRGELRARADTQDVVQEAVIDVLEYGPRFEISDEDCFRALVARIVENNLHDHRRFLLRDCRDMRRERSRLSDSVLALDPPRREITAPPVRASRAENEEWVRLSIELLSPSDRDVILLREWEQLSFEEIGSRLGIPHNTARMRFQRAMPRLARKVEELRSGRAREALRLVRQSGVEHEENA
ncbi:MAG: sigma-70 family RNA polymerase sigma factor [Planctomycetes bacterium]|nr:sigma-70 family RNA polymerase sigma factor [Planctomycetota bacterium]MCB9917651.1 sigma-70 family RNA polymerase sigma factor [Planctomycetota bacterium]